MFSVFIFIVKILFYTLVNILNKVPLMFLKDFHQFSSNTIKQNETISHTF